jgi:hypothetical protein
MPEPTNDSGLLTIAAIRTPRGAGTTEYLFNERQQIFALHTNVKTAGTHAGLLKDSHAKKMPVNVVLDAGKAMIRRVDAVSPEEHKEFKSKRVLVEKPEKPVPFDLTRIDPTTFNIAGDFLKSIQFRLCTNVIPNFATAKKIFDYCAAQGCYLPGPKAVSPCIPFQYVIDGCYARAHKMRWIITTRYGYCCEKVFSFANVNLDRLSVRAGKWGGCCVTWWYHVAPLVRVRSRRAVMAMVIDPGMFDAPVLLHTWLAAQENKVCNANAKVSKFSIQPGTAYTPANYAGTAFNTDPAYAATDATLIAYKNRKTCP